MQKRLALVLSIIMIISILAACAKKPAAEAVSTAPVISAAPEESPVGMVNPVIEAESYQALCNAVTPIKLADAPEGADSVTYTYINTEPLVAQINFNYGGNEYTYRAAACENESAQTDISGVYDTLENEETNSNDGGSYKLRSSKTKTMGVAQWYDDAVKCQYSLYTPTGCDINQQIEDVTDILMAAMAALEKQEALKVPGTDGEIEGKLLEVNDNDIIVSLDNGSTLVFLLTHIENVQVKTGDTVKVGYSGSLSDSPEALSVTVLSSAPAELVLNGTISQFDSGFVYVKTETANVYGFALSEATKYMGASKTLKEGNIVSVGYTGDLSNMPVANEINTVTVAKDAPDPLVNKSIKGTVKTLKSKSITVMTDNGHDYTFQRTADSKVNGDYELKTASHVKVTYDGYASKSPVAKVITVLAPPDPTPPKPTPTYAPAQYYTVRGVILVRAGNALSIQDSYGQIYSFLLRAPQIVGDGYPGDTATVTFYIDAAGSNVVTKVVYNSVTPVVVPTIPPAPTTQPIVSRTIYGVVIMQAGNALSVQDDSGTIYSFLLGAPEIVGSGGVGDYVTVTYQDYGTRVNATKIVYHNVDYTVMAPGPAIGGGVTFTGETVPTTSMTNPAIGDGASFTGETVPTTAQ